MRKVYPRPCGETRFALLDSARVSGLSPPMRGNRGQFRSALASHGSIPAHAGKPVQGGRYQPYHQVYPRPCGETPDVFLSALTKGGLSPPMRGNLRRYRTPPTFRRSIPAHAGKPVANQVTLPLIRVYPRPCGETRTVFESDVGEPGLSPPMRGKPFAVRSDRVFRRVYPRHAGKPQLIVLILHSMQVYPRPCGETLVDITIPLPVEGLSPPMRGNRP